LLKEKKILITKKTGVLLLIIAAFMLSLYLPELRKDKSVKNVPVKGMVTMVDLGSTSCIPCKMMEPILKRVEKKYAGKAAIVFLDIGDHSKMARNFHIRAIPTQIFFDRNGEEVTRHEGFMGESEIVAKLEGLGVK
jgi:thioredoxin 1